LYFLIIIIIIIIRQLIPTSWNASNRGLRSSVVIVFSSSPLLIFPCFGGIKIAQFTRTYEEASPGCALSCSSLPVSQFCSSVLYLFGVRASETLLCSVSAPRVKLVPLLGMYQLLMLDADIFMKTHEGSGCIDPRILDIGTSWR
jgi:hypothetical protein